MSAMRLQVEKPKASGYLKPLLIVLLIAGAILAWAYFMPQAPSAPLAFEVVNFEGDAQIYDLESRSWRAPKRGEEFGASQKIKTGADGQINLQVENEIRLRMKGNSELENKQSALIGNQEVYKLHFGQGVLFGVTTKEFDRKQALKKAVLQITTPKYDVDVLGSVFRLEAALSPGERNWAGVLRGAVDVRTPSLFFRKGGIRIRGLERANVIEGMVQPAARVSQQEWGTLKEGYQLLERTAVKEAEQIDLSKHAGTFFQHVFDHGTFYTPKIGYAGREFYKDPDTGGVYFDAEYDVFPDGSFVGIYIKTRGFDLSQYEGISFDVRRSADEGVPDNFFIEVKSKGNVIRRFSPHGFERTWKKMEFDFRAQKPTPVSEVVFVFTNARVGEAKKGVLQFRDVNLIPRKTPLEAPVKVEEKAPVVAAVPEVSKSVSAVSSPVPGAIITAVPVTVSTATQVPAVPLSAPRTLTTTAPVTVKTTIQMPAVPQEIPLE